MFAATLRPLLDVLRLTLTAPAQPGRRTPLDLHKFDFGICRGLRGGKPAVPWLRQRRAGRRRRLTAFPFRRVAAALLLATIAA